MAVTKHNQSNLSATPPPELNLVQSKGERKRRGVDFDYMDSYNQGEMVRYNNEYNYWLWQQQADYNSPAQQRARLEAAGLNPNYNSVDSGNLGSIPSSSGSITPSIGKNRAIRQQMYVDSFNALVKSIGEGVSSVSKLSGIPNDVPAYRRMLTEYMGNKLGSSQVEYMLKQIEAVFKSKTELGIDLGWMFGSNQPDGSIKGVLPDWENSPVYKNLGLKNEDLNWLVKLREFDFNNTKPAELKSIQERARQIGASAGLTEKQNELFSAMTATKIGAMLGPLLLGVIKLLL